MLAAILSGVRHLGRYRPPIRAGGVQRRPPQCASGYIVDLRLAQVHRSSVDKVRQAFVEGRPQQQEQCEQGRGCGGNGAESGRAGVLWSAARAPQAEGATR